MIEIKTMSELTAITTAIALAATPALAVSIGPNVRPETIGPVQIKVRDSATGGCWTNLGEAQQYAADQMELAGFEVTEDWATYNIDIFVHSKRVGGKCYGRVSIELAQTALVDDVAGIFIPATHSGIFTGYQNANTIVLDYIKELATGLRDVPGR